MEIDNNNQEYLKVYNLTPIIIVKGDKTLGFKKIASFNIEKERDLAFKISYPNSIIKDISPN